MTKRLVTRMEQVRSWSLLAMQYRPAELALEIGCDDNRVHRVFIPAGCPHTIDATGHTWIVGTEFRDWANRTMGKTGDSLREGQGYCLRCHAAVEMIGGEIKAMGRTVERIVGTCPTCGATVNRMRARGAV
jgi:hypothetical protein